MLIYLNLLPEKERKKIALESIYKFIVRQGVFLIILFLTVTIGVWLVYVRLKNTINNINQTFEEKNEKNKPLSREVELLNKSIDHISKTQTGYFVKSKILIDFAELVPKGVIITDFVLTDTNEINIDGVYANRDDVVKFKANLEKSFLINIQFPISNLLKQTDGLFSIHGMLAPEEINKSAL
jgi:Tfp pilus assembly protein PilN